MSLAFTATMVAILALLMGSMSWSVWRGTLPAMPWVALIPGLSIAVSVLFLAVRTGHLLLPFVVAFMIVAGIALIALAAGAVAADYIGHRRRTRNQSAQEVELSP